jgi:hypothetical protein
MSDESGRARNDKPGTASRVLPLLPGLLLTLVASSQLALHRGADLSPWKGGGFGMFSSNDGGWSRHTHFFVSDAAGEVEVDLPEELEDSEKRLRALPTNARLDRFARELSATVASEHPDHSAVRIELWRTRFDPDDLTPQIELMRDHRHATPGDVGS